MNFEHLHIVILAAGKGTRMKSDLPKVLHKLRGTPLFGHVLAAARQLDPQGIIGVVGYKADMVKEAFGADGVLWALQAEQLGTGHAVQEGLKVAPDSADPIVVLYGDVPLIEAATLQALCTQMQEDTEAGAVIITAVLDDPAGYGRVIRNAAGEVVDIVEQADCSLEQAAIKEGNIGIGIYRREVLDKALRALQPNNAQGEFYLTDVVRILAEAGVPVRSLVSDDAEQFRGVNTVQHLEECEKILEQRIQGE